MTPTKDCIEQLNRIIWRLERWQHKHARCAPVSEVNHMKHELIGMVNKLEHMREVAK